MFRKDILVIIIAALAVGLLFGYHAFTGTEVPVWQALAVAAVNILAAGKLYLTARKAREQAREQHRNPPS